MVENEVAVAGQGWQPIESAPKDGTRVLLTDGASVEAGCFAPSIHGDDFPWAFVDDYSGVDTTCDGAVGVLANAWKAQSVTHWQPLPPPPAIAQATGNQGQGDVG